MKAHRVAANTLSAAVQRYTSDPGELSLHAIEPAMAAFWRTLRGQTDGPRPVRMKTADDLLGRLSAESVSLGLGVPFGEDLEDAATRLNVRLCRVVRGREGFMRGDEEALLSMLGMAALRAFYTALLCCYGGRAVEAAPFIRQLVEITCQFSILAKVPNAATIWAERDSDPEGAEAKLNLRRWEETFEWTRGKPRVQMRFTAITPEHKEALEHAWNEASETSHTRWKRVMGIPSTAKNGDYQLDLVDPPHLVIMVTQWLIDVAFRCTEEMAVAWRIRDPGFPDFDDGLQRDLPVIHRKYRRIVKKLKRAWNEEH